MRIAMASDHAGRALKEKIEATLEDGGREVLDWAPTPMTRPTCPTTSCPPPRWQSPSAGGPRDHIDGVGYGSAMIANKVAGVFAAVCGGPVLRRLARSHSDSNVLCIGGRVLRLSNST